MDIKHIITFLKVVENKSFTKTANELQYSQSTISFHIQSLEKELGVQLFERKARELKITKEGSRIINSCKLMKECYHEILDITSNYAEIPSSIHIASVNSYLIYRLGSVIKHFKAMYPELNILLNNSPSSQYGKLLNDNSVDLCFFVGQNISDENIELVQLNREPTYLIFPNSYTFKNLFDLAEDLTACFSEEGCSYRDLFQAFHDAHGIKPKSSIESWSIEMIKQCVSSGIGYSILPEMCIRDDIKTRAYQAVPLDVKTYYVDIILGYKKNRVLPSHLKHFINLIASESDKYNTTLLSGIDY